MRQWRLALGGDSRQTLAIDNLQPAEFADGAEVGEGDKDEGYRKALGLDDAQTSCRHSRQGRASEELVLDRGLASFCSLWPFLKPSVPRPGRHPQFSDTGHCATGIIQGQRSALTRLCFHLWSVYG